MPDLAIIQLKEQAVLMAARAVVQRAQAGGPIETLLTAIDVLRHRLKDLDEEQARHAVRRPEEH
ncbi:MAG TPA: hypothetical protein VNP04_15700 [Alphaproteobacteria bacterium]|nr:hypothetical protein [Alphaproteobacteria bacterium]